MPFQEVVEAEGHLIDSHIMENIFDKVVEYSGRFEVEQFRIGRTNSEPSYLRLKVETPDEQAMRAPAPGRCWGWAAPPADTGDAALREVERDRCAPEDFYSTTNHRTFVRHGQKWIEVENQRMDAMVVVGEGRAVCRRLRDLRRGDRMVVGLRGIRVIPESKERDRLAFAFMANGISSERQVETAVRQTAALVRQALEQKQKVVVVAGPVVVHTGGVAGLSALIRNGWVQAAAERQRAGRARRGGGAVRHFAGRAPGRRPPGGARPPQSHARHQRHLSRGLGAAGGGERAACARAFSTSACEAGVPFVLAGSLRDDGPLPETITDMNAAQDAYAGRAERRGPGALPGLHAALHRHRKHAAELGQNRVRGYQPGGGHQGQRPRHRPGRGGGGRRRPFSGSAVPKP